MSKRRARVVAVILLLREIMSTYFYCILKGLICIIIIAFLNRQPSSYTECTKLNMRLFCNIKLIFNMEYICFIYGYNL